MNIFKKLLGLAVIALAVVTPNYAQQYQSQTAPIYATNAKYANGVSPGFALTAGTGLNILVGQGTSFCNTVIQERTTTAADTPLALTASTTNYVYLDTTANCAPAVSTSVFTATQIPLARVVTGTSSITSIDDVRGYFFNSAGTPGDGTVTNLVVGNLSPLFTSGVTNPTSTPSVSYTLSTTANDTVFANFSGSTGAPSWWTLAAGANITFTPSGSTLIIAATGGGGGSLTLEHNGVALTDQSLLNFSDTTPSAPAGNENVTFQSNSGGALSGYIPTTASQLQFTPTPPISGQYVVVYATAVTPIAGGLGPGCGMTSVPTGSTFSTINSLIAGNNSCGNGLTSNQWGALWSNYTLPSYVVPANVTAIYAFAVNSFGPWYPGTSTVAVTCTPVGSGAVNLYTASQAYNLTQFTQLLSTATGSNIGSTTCTGYVNYSNPPPSGAVTTLNMPSIGLIVYYTGSAPPATNTINVGSPLFYNAADNTLGIDPNAEFPASRLVGVTVSTLPAAAVTVGTVTLIKDGTTSTDCTTGGGSNPVVCYSNGTAYSAYGGGGGSGITALTGDVTATGPGSVAATVVDIPPHVALTGTPSPGQVPTATGGTSATWQTPSAASNSPQTVLLPNDTTTGTTVGLMACWNTSAIHQQEVVNCPAGTASNGTDNNPPIVGVCVAGCGTSGLATIQFAGQVSWNCDMQLVTPTVGNGYWVQVSATTAGECTQPTGSFAPSPNENPEGNTVLGRVLALNSGVGTAGTIELLPFGSYGLGNGTGPAVTNFALLFNGSPFGAMSYSGQEPSTFTVPYAIATNGLFIHQPGSNAGAVIGNAGLGVSGTDISFDMFVHGSGSPPQSMFRFDGSQYQPPSACGSGGFAACSSATGTITLGGHNGNFDPGNSTGVFIIKLAGNATTFTPVTDDNPGHILTFEFEAPASGGPFTWAWPSGFVNAPTISLSSGANAIVAQFLFDGTNYNYIP